MKYKIGDRVQIKSFDWFRNEGINIFNTFMMKHYGEVVTIKSANNGFYRIKEDGGQYCWNDDMIECKVEEEKSKSELKFKIGDKVRIKGFDWYYKNMDETGDIECSNNIWFYREMSKFCGKVMTISHVRADHYTMVDDFIGYWTDEMIECKVEEETKPESKFKVGDIITNGKVNLIILTILSDKYVVKDNFGECGILYFNTQDGWKIVEEESNLDLTVKGEEAKERIEITIPEGYEYVIESDKIIFTKKKGYPKTYEDCCTVLRFHYDHYLTYDDEKDINPTKEEEEFIDLMDVFSRLIVCRNAYWKIAGEEMGLGKSWEPDWSDEKQDKYGFHDEVKYTIINSAIFVFPTEEMKDEFYENFKKEIEICKGLS